MPLSAPDDTIPVIANGHDASSPLRSVCSELAAKVNAFLSSSPETPLLGLVQEQTRTALGVVSAALEKYGLDQIAISYNGGKDCLVLLILFLSALAGHPEPLPRVLQSVYIISPHPFDEVDDFVDSSEKEYQLGLSRYAMPMREAFETYLHDKPAVRAIFVGTRRTDPHGMLLTHFDMTDKGWPSFMRIHPVIDWHYAEIWAFIRQLEIPYCKLYDLGYTSLGGTTDTHPNPALKETVDDDGIAPVARRGSFRPAYELVEDQAERLGRDQ